MTYIAMRAISLACLLSSTLAFVPTAPHRAAFSLHSQADGTESASLADRRDFVVKGASTAIGVAAAASANVLPAEAAGSGKWAQVTIPFQDTLYDREYLCWLRC